MCKDRDNDRVDVEAFLQQYYAADERAVDAAITPLLQWAFRYTRDYFRRMGLSDSDREDQSAEAIVRIVKKLRLGRSESEQRVLRFSGFVPHVAQCTYYDWVRKYRGRRRWKLRLEVLLDSKEADVFARWLFAAVWLCGFREWTGRGIDETDSYRRFLQSPVVFHQDILLDKDPRRIPLPSLLSRLFCWLATPIPMDILTDYVSSVHQRAESVRQTISLEDWMSEMGDDIDRVLPPDPQDVEQTVLTALASDELRVKLWYEVCELPPRQRAALLLALPAEELLLICGRMSEAARGLELDVARMAEILRELPLNDQSLSDRLGCTTQQVANLRVSARKRLARRLSTWDLEETDL